MPQNAEAIIVCIAKARNQTGETSFGLNPYDYAPWILQGELKPEWNQSWRKILTAKKNVKFESIRVQKWIAWFRAGVIC